LLQVRLRLRPGVHLVVHGRGEKQRRRPSQKQRGQDVVGQTLSGSGNEVSGGRRHNDQVGGLAQLDMRERPAPLPEGAQNRAPGERLESDRTDKLPCPFGQYYLDLGTGFDQAPGKDAALIAGDTAGHAEYDASAGPHGHASERRRRRSL